ncbi:MAG: DUF1848 domain-containing protein [Erysipelotrichaceae bacterium]|nr:DUF1848 domain-containing protein [Erysipelotrichaceae bacterium]MDD3810446.1 DUF1848 domain-containing protein [Erysipelotrichaceae bacterium]
MIINTGQRTDIPAFYSEWFYNRVREGYVLVQSPYNEKMIYEYQLDPQVVDCLCFCTKNPQPMIGRLDEIGRFNQLWFVTITPYSTDIEPNVPKVKEVIRSFQELSNKVGKKKVVWRYDPIIVNRRWPVEKHLLAFGLMAKQLSGYTSTCVISFIDLYQKTRRNFPGIKEVDLETQHHLARSIVAIAAKYQIRIQTCHEGDHLGQYGIDVAGCMTQAVLEKALDVRFDLGRKSPARPGCDCLIGSDIGVYNTCMHGCLYCYANSDYHQVKINHRSHDPSAPMLVGQVKPESQIKKVDQKSNIVETLF